MKDLRREYKLEKKEHKNTFTFTEVIFIALTFGLVVFALTAFIVYNVSKKTSFDSNLTDIVNSYEKIVDSYYEDVDKTKLAESAIDGMFDYLNEDYSKLLDNNSANTLTDSLTDSYKGIGIVVYSNGKEFIVHDVVKNSVSYNAGIQTNDIIKSINGKELTSDMTTDEVSKLVKEKDKVKLVIIRDGKEREYTLTVGKVSIPVVSSDLYEDENNKIGYIYLDSFTSNAVDQFKSELEILEHKGMDSLIIDLRDNTGGYLSAAEDIASLFIKKGKTIYTLEGKNMNEKGIDQTEERRDYPVVVLINEYTASASEVLALALKESYGATLIGTKSYGKGKVQVTSTLSNGDMLKQTAAKWYSPNGNNIDGKGITPGIYVEQNISFILKGEEAVDAQLDRAREFLVNNK